MSGDAKYRKLRELFRLIRDEDVDFTPQLLELLVTVPLMDKPTMSDLADQVGYSLAGVNKTMAKLAVKFNRVDGLGLVHVDYDPDNARQKLVRLTPKGRKFLDSLSAYL